MFGKLLEPEIRSLIHGRDFAGLRRIFCDWPAADLAELISDLPEEDQVVLFRMLPHNLAGSTFEYLSRHDQKCLLQAMGREDIVKIINQMSPDDPKGFREQFSNTIAMKRYGTNEEVASLALFLASDESSYCNGGIFMIDGGFAAA